MKKLIIATLAATLVASFSANAQQTTKLTAAKHNEYGLVYMLPLTHFDIVITVKKTINKVGPYYQYSKKYLGATKAVSADAQECKITDVVVNTYGVPDNKEEYLMQFKSGSAPFLMLNSQGLPMSINTEADVKTVVEPKAEAPTTTVFDNDEYLKSLPGELLVSESTAKRAEIAANMIYKIRESRTNFATGEADQMPPDGASMKLVLEQLDKQEAALTALFLGTTKTETIIKHVDYLPKEEVNKVLCRVSNYDGIVDKDDLSGDPIYITLKVARKGELPVNEKGEVKKLPKGAVMYKIPGEAKLTLSTLDKEIYKGNLPVAQFGMDFGLDPAMFTDKKAPAYVIFHEDTGGIKELGILETEK